jgi:6-phosphogluconolactonase
MPILTRRKLLAMSAALPHSLKAVAATINEPVFVYIGTDTDATDNTAKGIYQAVWDAVSGTLTAPVLSTETLRPVYLAGRGRHVYSVNEINGAHDTITVFARSFGGRLRVLNSVEAKGVGPTYISIHPTGNAAYVANYGNGSVTSFRILADGRLSDPVSHDQHTGSGPKPEQKGPHAHSAVVSPDGNYLLVNDLGADTIYIYSISPQHPENFTPHGKWSALPGSGPRHIVFSRDGQTVYSVNELASTVDVLSWDAKAGVLAAVSSVSTLAEGFTGTSSAAEILLSPDGRYLYVSNRGEDTVAVFSVGEKGITFLQRIGSGGKTPRYTALSPDGKWLLAANLDSANIVVFQRDAATGKLSPTGNTVTVPHPLAILFT